MLVVGTARQSLQWIAREAEGWATYHREEAAQEGRIGLWQQALVQRGGPGKPFVQSMLLDLQADRRRQPSRCRWPEGRRMACVTICCACMGRRGARDVQSGRQRAADGRVCCVRSGAGSAIHAP